jgi:hypothetical protein
MKNKKTFYILLLMFGVLFGSVSCAPGIRLNTQAQGSEIKGNYTVIYLGCNFLNDLETIVFLEKEGGEYSFVPYAPDFKYRVNKGLSAEEAITTALKFVNCNASFSRTQFKSILAPNGETIGYEVRPLYQSFTYGVDDVLDVNYWLKDNKVVITIRLVPSIEMMLQDGGGNHREK